MNKEAIGWLRQQVTRRLETARTAAAIDEGTWRFDYQARPVARIVGAPWESSYNDGIWNCDDPEDGCDDLRRAGWLTGEHIALNDPQDVIARCEAELAIVTRCEAVLAAFASPVDGMWPDVTRRERTHASATLHDLASGYRHRDGYTQHWGEE